jgi:tRNA pseudouridine38-40 synthase
MPKCRYAIRLAYDGRPFRGFARQPGLATVEDALRGALRACGVEGAMAVAARTDAGVHALSQVVSVSTSRHIDPDRLRAELNRGLPGEILCLEVRSVAASFHARASALSRRYAYLVGAPPPAGLVPYAWTLPDERAFPGVRGGSLDVDAMRAALAPAIGRHDFAGFARPGAQRETIRELLAVEVVAAASEPLVAIVLEGTGFLRAMVRNLAGTAVTVGLGLAPTTAVADILRSPARYRGVRAPGWGLTLVEVKYPPAAWGAERPPEGA